MILSKGQLREFLLILKKKWKANLTVSREETRKAGIKCYRVNRTQILWLATEFQGKMGTLVWLTQSSVGSVKWQTPKLHPAHRWGTLSCAHETCPAGWNCMVTIWRNVPKKQSLHRFQNVQWLLGRAPPGLQTKGFPPERSLLYICILT